MTRTQVSSYFFFLFFAESSAIVATLNVKQLAQIRIVVHPSPSRARFSKQELKLDAVNLDSANVTKWAECFCLTACSSAVIISVTILCTIKSGVPQGAVKMPLKSILSEGELVERCPKSAEKARQRYIATHFFLLYANTQFRMILRAAMFYSFLPGQSPALLKRKAVFSAS